MSLPFGDDGEPVEEIEKFGARIEGEDDPSEPVLINSKEWAIERYDPVEEEIETYGTSYREPASDTKSNVSTTSSTSSKHSTASKHSISSKHSSTSSTTSKDSKESKESARRDGRSGQACSAGL